MRYRLPPEGTLVDTNEVLDFVSGAMSQDVIAFDTETDDLHGDVLGISFYHNGVDAKCYIPLHHDMEGKIQALEPIFKDSTKLFLGHNIKYDMHSLDRMGIQVQGKLWDTFVAAWMLDENRPLDLKSLALSELGVTMTTYEDLCGKGKKKITLADIPFGTVSEYSQADSYNTYQLYKRYNSQIIDQKLEMPFLLLMQITRILFNMERLGIKVDVPQLKVLEKSMSIELIRLTGDIWDGAGKKFNINSSQQLGEVLQKLGHKLHNFSPKTHKPSVDADTLKEIGGPFCEALLRYKELSKLKSTYTEGLRDFLDKGNRVHTNFKIGGTITGRLSSSKPNLQNIPIRSEMGKEIRKCFVAPDGYRLIVGDYANIELRILAHFSGDAYMCEAFRNNESLHNQTAIQILGAKEGQITASEKARAKAINFGLMYGMGPKSLGWHLKCSEMEARVIYQRYFEVYASIWPWKEKVLSFARTTGYVLTLFGRRRHVPDINSTNQELRARAERQAVNSKIQGSCSDIVYAAMRNVNLLLNDGLKLLLQVHDELVFESDDVKRDIPLIADAMETRCQYLNVPVAIELTDCQRWGDAKG